jgi:hypothetical protein
MLTPGQMVMNHVTLGNQGNTPDQLAFSVEGVPAAWVQGPVQGVALNAGEQLTTTLLITAPRTPASRAGGYMVTVQARSLEHRGEMFTAHANWTVLPFTEGRLTLEPKSARGRLQAKYIVTVHNMGNAPTGYRLAAWDDKQTLRYRFASDSVLVEPGAPVKVELVVLARPLFSGPPQAQSFQVRADAEKGDSPPWVTSQFIHQVLIPGWAALTLFVVGTLLVMGLWAISPWLVLAFLVPLALVGWGSWMRLKEL